MIYSQPVPVVAPVFVPYLGLAVLLDRLRLVQPFCLRDRLPALLEPGSRHSLRSFSNLDRFPVQQARNDFADRSRNTLQTAQRRGDFAQSRTAGDVKGGIGGYRGGVKTGISSGVKAGGTKSEESEPEEPVVRRRTTPVTCLQKKVLICKNLQKPGAEILAPGNID